MTLRRYSPLKPSRGTQIPMKVRFEVRTRDENCVGPRVGMPEPCYGRLELDHVRASHGIGMKSESNVDNLVALCSEHHLRKTLEGRKWRPALIAYLEEKS